MSSTGMSVSAALKELGLDQTATENDVTLAYRDLAKIWHPDRFQNDARLGARTEAQIKLINEAKQVALAYLEKHGHFRYVGREKTSGTRRKARPKPEAPQTRKMPKPRPKPPARSAGEPMPPRKDSKQTPAQAQNPTRHPFQVKFNTTVLVGIVLVFALASFLFTMGSALLRSPAGKTRSFPKTIRAQATLTPQQSQNPKPIVSQQEVQVTADTFFTLGSDKDWVSKVQGPPMTIQGSDWVYGFSRIRFAGGQVVGWKASELNPLNTGMLLDSDRLYPSRTFGLGSWTDEVAALQGIPDIIEGQVWSYGEAWVEFDADTVLAYENDQRETLKTH